jgi:hypothetical protein
MSRPRKEGNQWFYPISLNSGTFSDIDCLESFMCVPELNAIINLKARYFSHGVLKVVNKQGKEIKSHHYNALLQKPNWFQAQKEFMMQTKLFHEIYGNEYLYTLFPVGFESTERTKAIFTLPPNLVESEYNEKDPFYTFSSRPENIKYIIDIDGSKKDLDSKTIIHLNDNRVCIKKINDKSILKGESKLVALKAAINNIRMAYESRGIIIKYRGSQGIISPDSKDGIGSSVPFEDSEKAAIQAAYKSYGTLTDQSQIIITNIASKFQAMTVNDPKKLGLFDECEEDFYAFLDSFGLPADLFSSSKGTTFTNKNEARKDIIENTTIPEANEWAMGLNEQLMADDTARVIVDYSHLPVMQTDLKVQAEGRNATINYLSRLLQDKQITQEEYREELNKIGIGNGKAIAIEGDSNQQEVETRSAQAALRGSVGGVQGILGIQAAVSAGTTSNDAALSMLTIVFGFTNEQAVQLLGEPAAQPTQNTPPNEETEE